MNAVISDRFLRMDDVAKILGVSKKTVERMEKRGSLPAMTRLSYKTVGMSESRLKAFMSTL
ncbi:helix-turn-helix transcriptional regulator [Pseudomonas sp. sp1636]|uniref:helix-turn-helix transcriptional regulator n=1 Tax=Pseudomonas sp. sp1636 TaxID=3036707 RepID=UPI0035B64906